jgi:hypothetical protein
MSKHKSQRNPNEAASRPTETNRTGNGTSGQNGDPKPFYKQYDFWMLIVVAIYSVATIGLWIQTKRATEATKISADAEVATARAWIVVLWTKWNALPSFEDVTATKWIPGDFQLLNTGHTPAMNPKMGASVCFYHPDGDPDPQTLPECPDTPPPRADAPEARESLVISPGTGVNMHWACKLPPNEYDAVSHGHASVYLLGCIWYNVVSSSRFGVTEYCVEWKPNGKFTTCHANNSLR